MFLVLIFCIKLLRKNNENFESNSSAKKSDELPFIKNHLIKEASKNIDSEYSDQITSEYYQKNPELKV